MKNTSSLDQGLNLLLHPKTNKSTAFTIEEREKLGLSGLLPYQVSSIEKQKDRVLENIRRKDSNIEKYIAMQALQNRNERLFYRTLIDNIEELLPIVYTPTVGQACKEFAHIFRQSRGFYINMSDKGKVRKNLDNWPDPDVKIAVVTDGERILGLGDLGANGMGISIGKLSLYTACAGISPDKCLPIMIDVGTNNKEFLEDPLYLGMPQKRVGGAQYDELIEEILVALKDKWPNILIQFEDFLTPNAYRILQRYQNKILCFNDDIQGTAAMALAGIFAATKISQVKFRDNRFMFLGAGSAATGIGDLIVKALVSEGLSEQESLKRISFVDVHGLLVKSRKDLQSYNLPYAHDNKEMSFVDAINYIQPSVLIGATGTANTFTKEAVCLMAKLNARPIIFALSNPTSHSECTAEQAYTWSDGRCVFASGSPFAEVVYNNKRYQSGQGNNVYVFPGVGLGAIISRAKQVSVNMFLAAAKTLAENISESRLNQGSVYPALSEIRKITVKIALSVARTAISENNSNLSQEEEKSIESIVDRMYDPTY